MGPELLLFMGVLVVGMFVMNSFAKKSQKKRQEEQERTLKEQLIPGAWVQTYSGFFGRFVDFDGDVVILETPSGEETYWIKAAIRAVTDPPFETIGEGESDHTEAVAEYDFDLAEKDLDSAGAIAEVTETTTVQGDGAEETVEVVEEAAEDVDPEKPAQTDTK